MQVLWLPSADSSYFIGWKREKVCSAQEGMQRPEGGEGHRDGTSCTARQKLLPSY
jgi:hypothetical protein